MPTESQPMLVMAAIAAQLAVITTANGYNTDVGSDVRISNAQRGPADMPSTAIASRSGDLNLSAENQNKSPRARRMAIEIEAGVALPPGAEDHAVAHLILEDIERAFEVDSRRNPAGVGKLTLDSWSMVDRPEGDGVVLLQILGSADYIRPNTTPA